MKLHLLNRSSEPDRSLMVRHNKDSNFLRIWHYHPEFELVLVEKGTGMRFVGDSMEQFYPQDVVLIGKDIPHMWLNDESYFEQDSILESEAIAIHFKKNFLGEPFLKVPEMLGINQLMNNAGQGIKFLELPYSVLDKIRMLKDLDPSRQIILFLEILVDLANHENIKLLSSWGYLDTFRKMENSRLERIYEYIYQNFNTPISAGDVAEVVGMNKSSFSRFFKRVHRKSFTKYLNEMRVGYACKLLLGNEESITGIAFLSGFNNISNFNRQFKLIKGTTPSEYLKKSYFKLHQGEF